jgi:type VI protein secretion system component Hcp
LLVLSFLLKLPGVDGGATEPGYVGSFVLTSFDCGVVSPANPVGTGWTPNQYPKMKGLTVIRTVNAGTDELHARCFEGSSFDGAELHVLESLSDGTKRLALKYAFVDTRLMRIDWDRRAGDAGTVETLRFSYEHMTFTRF